MKGEFEFAIDALPQAPKALLVHLSSCQPVCELKHVVQTPVLRVARQSIQHAGNEGVPGADRAAPAISLSITSKSE